MALSLSLAKENFIYLIGGCITVVLIFAFLLAPAFYRERELTKELPEAQTKLKEQQQVKELLGTLQSKMKNLEEDSSLPTVNRHPLPTAEINTINATVNELAASTGLQLLFLLPELESTDHKESKKLRVESELRGQLSDISPFLLKILELPYVGTIRALSIQAAEGGQHIKLTFTVDLA